MAAMVTGALVWTFDAAPQADQGRGGAGRQGGRGTSTAATGEQLGAPLPMIAGRTIGAIDTAPDQNASYPRVMRVEHYAPDRGSLLATFARRGSMPIYRSADDGETWQLLSEIPELRVQPALFEMPRRMGEFPAGTILASAMSTAPGKASLDVHYSTDGGRTWQFLSTIAEGERAPYNPAQRAFVTRMKPVWEPYLYADASGRLVASFSDERYKDDGYNQLLDHRVSTDGGRTWGELVFDVAVPDGLTRAGMAVITRAGNGRFYMIYEMVGLPGYALEPRSNPVHIRVSDDGLDFGDPRDRGTLVQDRWRQFPWATPFIVWSPYPAPNGTLVVSARAVLRYDLGQVGNGVMINQNYGEGLWTLVETPIHYTPNPAGYSQTMIPIGDGREILQLVPVDGQIKTAKFTLPGPLPPLEFPFGPRR